MSEWGVTAGLRLAGGDRLHGLGAGAGLSTGMSSNPITRVSTEGEHHREGHHAEHPGDGHGVGRIEELHAGKEPGAAMEWLASPPCRRRHRRQSR